MTTPAQAAKWEKNAGAGFRDDVLKKISPRRPLLPTMESSKRQKSGLEDASPTGLELFRRLPGDMQDEISARTRYTAPAVFAQLSRYSYQEFPKSKLYAFLTLMDAGQVRSCLRRTQEERDTARATRRAETIYVCLPKMEVVRPALPLAWDATQADLIMQFTDVKRFFCVATRVTDGDASAIQLLLDRVVTPEFMAGVVELAVSENVFNELCDRARQLGDGVSFGALERLHVHMSDSQPGKYLLPVAIRAPRLIYLTTTFENFYVSPKDRRPGVAWDAIESRERAGELIDHTQAYTGPYGERYDTDYASSSEVGPVRDRLIANLAISAARDAWRINQVVDTSPFDAPRARNRLLPGLTPDQLLYAGRQILSSNIGENGSSHILALSPISASPFSIARLIDRYATLSREDRQVVDAITTALSEIPWDGHGLGPYPGLSIPTVYRRTHLSETARTFLSASFRSQPLRTMQYAPFCGGAFNQAPFINPYLDQALLGRDGMEVMIEDDAQRQAAYFAITYLGPDYAHSVLAYAAHALYKQPGGSGRQTSDWVASVTPLLRSQRLPNDGELYARRAGIALDSIRVGPFILEGRTSLDPDVDETAYWRAFSQTDIDSGWAETCAQVQFMSCIWHGAGKLMVPSDSSLALPRYDIPTRQNYKSDQADAQIRPRVARARALISTLKTARVPELLRADKRCARRAWGYLVSLGEYTEGQLHNPITAVVMCEILAASGTAPDLTCVTVTERRRGRPLINWDVGKLHTLWWNALFREFAAEFEPSIMSAAEALAVLFATNRHKFDRNSAPDVDLIIDNTIDAPAKWQERVFNPPTPV